MNILIIHEIDWIKKVIFEPHHLSELLSLKAKKVFVMDCRESNLKKLKDGVHTVTIQNYNRIYNDASIELISPSAILIKGLNRLSYFIVFKKILRKFLSTEKIDIILLYGVATNGIQTIDVAKEFGIPVVFRALDVAHGLVKIPILRYIVKRCERKVIQNSKSVLVTTPELGRYIVKMGGKKEVVEVFDLGINMEIFKPLNKDLVLLKKIGIQNDDKVIVFMGTLYDFSGLDDIILNYHLLQNKLKNIKLLIVGGGPALNHLKTLIKNKKLEKDVFITGFIPQEDIPKHIALSDICINSFKINYITDSILPTKILEYFACSKPVLSTPLKGTIELLPNEEYGISYATPDKFIEKLIEMLQNKEELELIGKKGFEYVKKNHDWKKLSEKLYLKFKNKIIEG